MLFIGQNRAKITSVPGKCDSNQSFLAHPARTEASTFLQTLTRRPWRDPLLCEFQGYGPPARLPIRSERSLERSWLRYRSRRIQAMTLAP
jgi:hypothetical protein